MCLARLFREKLQNYNQSNAINDIISVRGLNDNQTTPDRVFISEVMKAG